MVRGQCSRFVINTTVVEKQQRVEELGLSGARQSKPRFEKELKAARVASHDFRFQKIGVKAASRPHRICAYEMGSHRAD